MNLEKQKRFLVQAAFYGTIAALVYVVLKFLLPTLIPFLLAFLIVWLLRKPAKWISGIPFDIAHCAGNFVIALLLFKPMRKLLCKLNQRMPRH